MNFHAAAIPEVDFIQIHLEDFFLAVERLHDHCHGSFLQLSLELAFRFEEIVLHELLRNGGTALDQSPCAKIGPEGAGDSHPVDAAVVVEPMVLDGDDPVDEIFGNLLNSHQ